MHIKNLCLLVLFVNLSFSEIRVPIVKQDGCFSQFLYRHLIIPRTVILSSSNDDYNFNSMTSYSGKTHFSTNKYELLEELRDKLNNYILHFNYILDLEEFLDTFIDYRIYDSRANYIFLTNNSSQITMIGQLIWNYKLYKSVILFKINETSSEMYQVDYMASKCFSYLK